MNTRKCFGLIVKSGSSPFRGIVALGVMNPICERGYQFFIKEKVSYTVNGVVNCDLRISHMTNYCSGTKTLSLFFWNTHFEVLCLIFTKYIVAEFIFMIEHRIQ